MSATFKHISTTFPDREWTALTDRDREGPWAAGASISFANRSSRSSGGTEQSVAGYRDRSRAGRCEATGVGDDPKRVRSTP